MHGERLLPFRNMRCPILPFLVLVASVVGYEPKNRGQNGQPETGYEPKILGLSVDNQERDVESLRIVNGYEVKPHSIPYQVSIQDSTGYELCGGALLSKNTVVTAAHCLSEIEPVRLVLVAGAHNLDSAEGTQQKVPVKKVIQAPHYDSSLVNDLAIVKTSSDFNLNSAVQPINLPKTSDLFTDQKAVVSGWGIKDPADKNSYSPTLMAANVEVYPNQNCVEAYGEAYDTEAMLCAGSDKNVGFCQGDDGGPLTCEGSSVLCGIASWQHSCADANYPTVYTRVTALVDWINKNM